MYCFWIVVYKGNWCFIILSQWRCWCTTKLVHVCIVKAISMHVLCYGFPHKLPLSKAILICTLQNMFKVAITMNILKLMMFCFQVDPWFILLMNDKMSYCFLLDDVGKKPMTHLHVFRCIDELYFLCCVYCVELCLLSYLVDSTHLEILYYVPNLDSLFWPLLCNYLKFPKIN